MDIFQQEFALSQPALRVSFGPGRRRTLPEEAERLGARRAAVLSTPRQEGLAQELADALGPLAAGVLPRAQMHTPVEVTAAALNDILAMRADCLVAVGGGSAIGLSKALALRTGLPQIALPTTYAGSEATPVLGQTKAGQKTTTTDARVQPAVILYDAELVRALPLPITVASAMNAIAHAAEGLYARDRNPIATLLAIEGMKAFRTALPKVCDNPQDLDARGETLYGAWLCGTVLAQVGMALHHKLSHVLGGSFGLPHAETHAILLPHTIAYNAAAVPELLQPVAEVFDGDSPGKALHDFARRINAPNALRDIGMKENDITTAAEVALRSPYWNPRELDLPGITALLRTAWAGDAPL